MTASSRRIAVIGAGISGLATAFWLNEKGCSVTLLEERSRVGGSIETVVKDGFLIELGPNNALETTPLIQNLVAELRIKDQLIYANASSKNRYIVRAGKMHRVPFSPIAFLSTPLFSSGAKLRLLREPFIRGGRNPSESLSVSRLRHKSIRCRSVRRRSEATKRRCGLSKAL
jgi:oxygen-dependent protoporphyrinogen oxidase